MRRFCLPDLHAEHVFDGRRLPFGDLNAQHASELPREVSHSAFEPVAAIGDDHLRYRVDNAGMVEAAKRHNEVDHLGIVAPGRMGVRTAFENGLKEGAAKR